MSTQHTPTHRLGRFVLPAAAAFALLAPVALAAPASAAVERGYDCGVVQVSGTALTGQFCQPRGGAPYDGLITGDFTVTGQVFDGTPGTASCTVPIPLTGLSGVLSANQTSTQVIGLKCVRTS